MSNTEFRKIPSVESVLNKEGIKELAKNYPRQLIVSFVRDYLNDIRKKINDKKNINISKIDFEKIIQEKIQEKMNDGLRKAVNATGVILHTGLGRAVLAENAIKALSELNGYSTLQVDIESGERNEREAYIEKLLRELTGVEAATLANNNAAATMLILNTFAKGKEAIVSRGQLIEIGGSFRLPDVMKQSGAAMVEIGTTNRTHLADYEKAITENTGLLLYVHPSNYKITGFTSEVSMEEMSKLAKKNNIIFVVDLGSGALIDLAKYKLAHEPTVQECLKAGADIVCFSADKLIGASQAGIIIGKKEHIQKIRKNSLARALRCGKLTIAVLEATLKLFFDEEKLLKANPTLNMLTENIATLEKRAKILKDKLKSSANTLSFSVEDDFSQVGSGSLTTENIPTKVVAISIKNASPDKLALNLRKSEPPIFSRIRDNKIILDLRTIFPEDEEEIIKAFKKLYEAR